MPLFPRFEARNLREQFAYVREALIANRHYQYCFAPSFFWIYLQGVYTNGDVFDVCLRRYERNYHIEMFDLVDIMMDELGLPRITYPMTFHLRIIPYLLLRRVYEVPLTEEVRDLFREIGYVPPT